MTIYCHGNNHDAVVDQHKIGRVIDVNANTSMKTNCLGI